MDKTPNGAPADGLDDVANQESNLQDVAPALIDPADVVQLAIPEPIEFRPRTRPPAPPPPKEPRGGPAPGQTAMPEFAQVSRPREARPPREPRQKPPAPPSAAPKRPSYSYEHEKPPRIRRSLRRTMRPRRAIRVDRPPWVGLAAKVLLFVVLFGLSLLVGLALTGATR
jgi:hypothetical protein